ncbi:hypothetical protein [Acinetobacter sp. ANC 4973]|uniref:hypothetical protein n=1 Tax=Acinetobacter sp. ANC 4973 TaxID=1977871 RepID=UPI000B575905|nr:hypothetical protein [Acinetobacter sp. ANC 4973]OTG98583.1 hypothetical protein B9T30_12940 [Acinetobacter sp. ANC 4973]
MKMISYWKKSEEIYSDGECTFIIGYYDHKNNNQGGDKALGIHWQTYPQSRGILSPCVIPKNTRNIILRGLLTQAEVLKDPIRLDKIKNAIVYFE